MTRYSPIAAVLVLVAVLVPLILPNSTVKPAKAQDVIMAPEGGRLDAMDSKGQVIGPCPLKGTDVDVAVSGRFTRVTIRQKFHNPYADKIEAVYTFPMSHRAAVDQMVMTVGDRVIVGEVKERQRARRIYEAARDQGYVASLLEQERPNIFTQSVANIEPGAEIDVQISYVELLESKDGTFSFDFPMVVEPRYIPGTPKTSPGDVAGKFRARRGVVILGPAGYRIVLEGDTTTRGKLRAEDLSTLIGKAQAIETPDDSSPERKLMVRFEASYAGGGKEVGEFYTDGSGHVNGRWFCVAQELLTKPGESFAPDTDQVPDAGKITPTPVRPEQRAGHDISINVTIDTGGPGIVDLKTPLHETIQTGKVQRDDGTPRKLTVELKKERDIPNRDFVLSWRQTADTIEEATFTHTGKKGKFFSLILQPPARVTDAQAVARELVFVLDTSGSMSGFPIEKAKEVMTKAIGALRPQDTFNLITFSGDTHILWDKPQPGTKENVEAAQNFVGGQRGSGGTEMMTAIEAALMQPPQESNPPLRICCFMTDGQVGNDQAIIDAVKRNAKTTRVFSFGIGNSVNRYLLDGMARAGRGEVEYVLLNGDALAAVNRFSQRIQTPVLTDVELVFSDGLKVTEMVPKTLPDLFDVKPIILHGKYTTAGSGTLTIRGRTAGGRYERTIPLELPAEQPEHDTIATLWARAKVEALMNENLAAVQTGQFPKELHDEVVSLGETFGIMTQYTSFVAVEKQRVTLGGRPRLVHVPIEMPQGVSFEGIFGLDAVVPRGFIISRFGRDANAIGAGPTSRPAGTDSTIDLAEVGRNISGAKYYGFDAGGGMGGGGMGGFGGGGDSEIIRDPATGMTLIQPRRFVQLHGLPPGGASSGETDEWRMVAKRDPFGSGLDNNYTQWGGGAAGQSGLTGGRAAIIQRKSMRPDDAEKSEFKADGKAQSTNLSSLNRARGNWYALSESQAQSAGANGLYADFEGDGADDSLLGYAGFGVAQGRAGGGGMRGGQLAENVDRYADLSDLSAEEAPHIVDALATAARPAAPGLGRAGFNPYGAVATTQPADGDRQLSCRPLRTYQLQYLGVEDAAKMLRAAIPAPRGPGDEVDILEDLRAERLLVKGSPENNAKIAALLKELDKPGATTRPADHRPGQDVIACFFGRGEIACRYDVKGVDLHETAMRLDGALVREFGFDAPYVRVFPEANQLIVSGPEEMQGEAARILAIFTNGAATTQPAGDAPTATRPAVPALKSGTLRLTAWLDSLTANKKLDAARMALVPQRVAIQAAELVKGGELVDARAMVEALVKFDGEFKIGAQMREVLADQKLAGAERDQKIAALAEEAKRAFDPIIRDIKLRMRLDERLYPFAAAGPAAATQPAPAGVELKDGKVRVTVVAADTQAPTLDAMRKAGLSIEGNAERTHLVIGLVAREQLGDLGVLDQVKRIEPTEPLE